MPWWNVRLEGGPADGDHAEVGQDPPLRLWVGWCESHREWHWFPQPYKGCEPYVRAELNRQSQFARFVYEDMITRAPHRATRERAPA